VLNLKPEDKLLEVGCGGGAFLEEALRSGCSAWAIDQSRDMVSVATSVNARATEEGRLKIVHCDASHIPFPDAMFNYAVMSGVLQFLSEPVATFREILRTLKPGGLLVVTSSTKELRGTPAAPEPIANYLRYYEDNELESLAKLSGFSEVTVSRPDMTELARKSGIPDSELPLYGGNYGQLLIARKK
jgi:ubiquinone/menaquinone biosynthesis C-methylase UbiE